MAPPLVVRAPPATLRIWLWALQRAPREAGLPAEVLRSIVGFLTPWFFFDLDAAIAAAVRGARGGLAEVVLQRTWTMPNPTHAALVNPAVWGQGGYVSARVPKRARVVLRAERGGGAAEAPRLRIHAPDAAASCALLGLGEGAQVTVRDLSLEVFHPRVHKEAREDVVVDVAWLPKDGAECGTKLELLEADATGFTGHTRKRTHAEI